MLMLGVAWLSMASAGEVPVSLDKATEIAKTELSNLGWDRDLLRSSLSNPQTSRLSTSSGLQTQKTKNSTPTA